MSSNWQFLFFFRVVTWLIGDFVGNWFREEMLSVIDRSTWSRFLAVSWEKKKRIEIIDWFCPLSWRNPSHDWTSDPFVILGFYFSRKKSPFYRPEQSSCREYTFERRKKRFSRYDLQRGQVTYLPGRCLSARSILWMWASCPGRHAHNALENKRSVEVFNNVRRPRAPSCA